MATPGSPAARPRGRLKIFFGAAPGVGKTFAMLEAAQRARAEGRGVVVGWVDAHGSAATTQLLEGLEPLLPQAAELDLDAALARRPEVFVLDELAHTNPKGARHAKRWQDVEELLEAGIDVHTTLNVQNLESLNDVVNQITGLSVHETAPDHVLEQAHEVEFVDLPPEDLLKRVSSGKVRVPDPASPEGRSFFRKGNLIALRELALRRTAERVDAQMQDYRRDHAIEGTWPVAERVLVCVRPHPDSPRFVRAAKRMAATLRAEWIVVSVESPAQPPLSTTDRESLLGALKLAEELGAETAVLSGESVSETLLAYARERNVSKIVVGKPAHARWRDRLKGSLLDEIVRESGEIDVFFIAGEGSVRARDRLARLRRRRSGRLAYLRAAAVVALCAAVCGVLPEWFDKSNLIMVYLLGVAFVATRYGRGPSAFAACLSVALFDFFFVPPHLTLAVHDTQHVVTFAVMLVVGLLISTLAVRVRDQAEAARRREQRTQVLYSMNRELAGRRSLEEIAAITGRHVAEIFRGPARLLVPDRDGRLPADDPSGSASETATAQWVVVHGRAAGLGTDTLPGAEALYVPVRSGDRVLAVLGLRPAADLRPLSPDQAGLLEALAHQAAAALERARLSVESEEALLVVERERLRSTLLSSVSHDFRTPLAAITGAITCLQEETSLQGAARRDLEDTIREEASRLDRLVTNLLDMTRLESGAVRLRRDWHSLEEVVGSALSRVDDRLGRRRVETTLPPELPLVPMDPLLVEQLFVNLLENALKYTPADSTIRIEARVNGEATVTVADDGPGLPPGEEERIFEKFHRVTPGVERGFGLGLPICRAIATAHGGRIWAEPQTPHGVAFHFTLPLETPEPAPPYS